MQLRNGTRNAKTTERFQFGLWSQTEMRSEMKFDYCEHERALLS